MNEHAISSVSLCADFKHVIHIVNEVEERELTSSLNIWAMFSVTIFLSSIV